MANGKLINRIFLGVVEEPTPPILINYKLLEDGSKKLLENNDFQKLENNG
tara:strand:+ start:15780 stop:15929 length:150 start_codon:yes stop_codon:yes gene_type:complete